MNSVTNKERVAEFGSYKDEEGQEREETVKFFRIGVSRNGVRHNITAQMFRRQGCPHQRLFDAAVQNPAE
jgi:hypothetical protein